jgi:hypothetical protein
VRGGGDGVDKESLSEEQLRVYKQNSHVRQVFANRRALVVAGRELSAADRILPHARDDEERLEYQSRKGEVKTVEHWGQRKLMIAELEFLTLYSSSPSDVVVYAGAAPGLHTNFLAELFPGVLFVLYDPDPFVTVGTRSVVIRQEAFTDEIAEKWRGKATLFISDIRTKPPDGTRHVSDDVVLADMAAQARWVRCMRPRVSMLKFRLPFVPGVTEYLDGVLHLPVWGGRSTSEVRLVVQAPADPAAEYPVRKYDHMRHSDAMFRHNIVSRTTVFEHSVQGVPGLDRCFDCSSEVFVVRLYLATRVPRALPPADEEVAALINQISHSIGITRNSLFVF